MARPIKRKRKAGDSWEVQVYVSKHNRKTIRFGTVSQEKAEEYAALVDAIAEYARQNNRSDLPYSLLRRVEKLPVPIRDRLAKAGLYEPPREWTVGEFVEHYMATKKAKNATKLKWRQAAGALVEFFGGDTDLRNITRGDADLFKDFLVDQELANSTIGKRLRDAKAFFTGAIRNGILERNPFDGVSHHSTPNEDRKFFITLEDTLKLIEAAPNTDWRVMIALGRFGGLRSPSEVLSLKWDGFDWERSRFRVDSPKTEHHPGGAYRMVPMFPELRPFLEEAWDAAEEGAVYVIGNDVYRKAAMGPNGWRSCNVRTQLRRIIKRAGLQPWPKTWHNLRSSRETELFRRHPIKAVCNWIGNSPKVAMKHYAQTTEADFAAAIAGSGESAAVPSEPADTSSSFRVESAAKSAAVGGRTTLHAKTENLKKPGGNNIVRFVVPPCTGVEIGRAGLEPATKAL